MSIWGKRVDSWVNGKAGTATREDYDRAGKNALWQIALVGLVVVAAVLLARAT
jgi:hypothetical protein